MTSDEKREEKGSGSEGIFPHFAAVYMLFEDIICDGNCINVEWESEQIFSQQKAENGDFIHLLLFKFNHPSPQFCDFKIPKHTFITEINTLDKCSYKNSFEGNIVHWCNLPSATDMQKHNSENDNLWVQTQRGHAVIPDSRPHWLTGCKFPEEQLW